MATKTFEELKQMAIQIRDEKTNKQNTATRIGTQMLEHLNKLEQEYYNKENIDEQNKQTDVKFSELGKFIGYGLEFEQGTLDASTGQPLTQGEAFDTYNKRIRTIEYQKIYPNTTIINSSNGKIYVTVYYYNQLNGNVIYKQDYTNSNIALSTSYLYYKLICKNIDDTPITPNNGFTINAINNNNSESINKRLISVENMLEEQRTFMLEQGTLDASTGQPLTQEETGSHYKRIRSKNYIYNAKTTIYNNLNNILTTVYLYDSIGGNVVKKIEYTRDKIELDDEYRYFKIILKKEDDTEISIDDIGGGIYYSTTTITNKKSYKSEFIRFKVTINESPLGVYNDAEASNPTTNPDNESKSLVQVTGVLALPTNYTPYGDGCKAIMLMMGGHGYVNDTMWYPTEPDIVNVVIPYFLSNGYAVFSCNGMKDMTYEEFLALPTSGFTSNLGLPDTIEAYWKSYQYVIQNYNIDPKIFLWGGSQGGFGVLNFTKMHANVVRAVACMGGMVDLEEQGWKLTGARGIDRITKILGFNSTSTYENSKADPWNPSKRIITVGDKEMYFFPVPIKVCYGTADEVLIDQKYIKRLAKAMINGKCTIYCKWYDGYNHMDVAFGFKEVVRKDIIEWFDRF